MGKGVGEGEDERGTREHNIQGSESLPVSVPELKIATALLTNLLQYVPRLRLGYMKCQHH